MRWVVLVLVVGALADTRAEPQADTAPPNNNPCSDPNAERVECAPVPSCRSTCAVPNPGPCILRCAVNECVCKQGYVLSSPKGKCIPVDQCPRDAPCNGDSNAVIIARPPPCPSTCDSPNASYLCWRAVPPVGCLCKTGYIQVEYGGKCIKPEKCPGGDPCGMNETFVPCTFRCPFFSCPVRESFDFNPCMPPYPCPSGCACKMGYRWKSSTDYTCILASDCPKNRCSDPNAERVECAVANVCRATCAKPNPGPCREQICIKNDCVCKKGYVLSRQGGRCIHLTECPGKCK